MTLHIFFTFTGLRSGKVGEQCEAIVRFPRLFEKYPFPILINSSFLKLADVFRVGWEQILDFINGLMFSKWAVTSKTKSKQTNKTWKFVTFINSVTVYFTIRA